MDDPDLQPLSSGTSTRRVVDQVELVAAREQVLATTERVAVATARLEKFPVIKQRTITIDVVHEDARLVYGPPPNGPGISPESQTHPAPDTVVLYAEEIEIVRRWVPVETARLAVTAVTTQETVTDTIQVEHIDTTRTTTWPHRGLPRP